MKKKVEVIIALPDCELARILRRYLHPRPLPKQCKKNIVEAMEAMNIAEAANSYAKNILARLYDETS